MTSFPEKSVFVPPLDYEIANVVASIDFFIVYFIVTQQNDHTYLLKFAIFNCIIDFSLFSLPSLNKMISCMP